MGLIPEDTIQEIRHRVDIVGLIGRYVELKRAGRSFKGRCPFHDEKTPSFNVNPDRGIFHCFGCSEGGDAIGFLMKHEGMSFPEAARTLAAECGIEVPEAASRERGLAERLYAANDLASRIYRDALATPEGRTALDYLQGRGLDDAAIEEFEIGFAPDRWDTLTRALERERIPAEIGEQAGLLGRKRGHYDLLRGRIVFPIHDVRGRVVGFGGRAISEGQEPKYLNTPETPVFRKRETFYGFPGALGPLRKAERAVVCEGYFDRIALARAGLGEALATCGTALTREHAVQLRRRTGEVVLLFDGDGAGRKAMERSLETLLPEGLRVRAAELPPGEDPDSFLAAQGADPLRAVVDASRDALEETMRHAVAAGCASPDQKADAVNRIAPLISRLPNPVERVEYARRLSGWTATDEAAVQAIVRSAAGGRHAPRLEPERAIPRQASGDERHLREMGVLLLRHSELAARFTSRRVGELLPAGSWKAVVEGLVDAAARGLVDEDGAVDHFALEDKLDEDARSRLREVAVDAELFRDTPLEDAFDDLVRHFQRRRVDALEKDLKQRMRDPAADHEALLLERDALLREKKKILERSAEASSAPRPEVTTSESPTP